MTQLVLVMPCYNEEGCIRDVVLAWSATLHDLVGDDFRMVIVNDGSRDRSGEILESMAANSPWLTLINQANAGHGAALLNAYRSSLAFSPQWVFHVDSDDQFVPEELKLLWDRRSESKFILGRRLQRYDALHRLVITRIVRLLLLVLYGRYLVDSNVPFRLIKGDYLAKLLSVLPENIFAPNIFLAVLAARDGQNLMSIPVTHKARQTGRVSIVKWRLIKACLRSARELFDFRLTLGQRLRALRA